MLGIEKPGGDVLAGLPPETVPDAVTVVAATAAADVTATMPEGLTAVTAAGDEPPPLRTVRVVCSCGHRLRVMRADSARGWLAELGEHDEWPCDRCGTVWPIDGKRLSVALGMAFFRRQPQVTLPLA